MRDRFGLCLSLVVLAACSGGDDGSSDTTLPSGTGGTGGTAAGAGGSTAATGGAAGSAAGHAGAATAGFPGMGAGASMQAGGSTSKGGATSAGGASSPGGATSSGGAGAGGTSASGGASDGGTTGAAGNDQAGGANAMGGTSSTGGSGAAPWMPYTIPADCQAHARIFTYNPVGDHLLTDAMGQNPAVCADYYIHEPGLAADKTQPRGPAAVDAVHAHGDQFHALAEFHWGGWSQASGTWYERGVAFRQKMLDAGYDPARDSWAINELPSTTKSMAAERQNVIDAVKGLYEGPPGSPPMGGLVFVIGIGSQTANFNVYKPALENWLADAAFWNAMNAHVRWWSQETYARPLDVCVGSATVAARASHMNDFAMHVAVLANAGGAQSSAAHAFFAESYVPAQTAFWHSDNYGTTITTLDNMKALVSNEIYASRSWATGHSYPDGRLALSWNDQLDGATEADVMDLASRIADSIHDAYDHGAVTAAHACSPSGAFTFCQCAAQNAAFNEGFATFQTW